MKNLITTLAISASLVMPMSALASVPYAAESAMAVEPQIGESHLFNVAMVMHLNDLSYEDAIIRIRHGLDSQNGKVGRSKEIPLDYRSTYNPRYNAFQQNGQGFYAGVDVNGNHRFLDEQRHQVLEGSYRYCPVGQTYVYEATESFCW